MHPVLEVAPVHAAVHDPRVFGEKFSLLARCSQDDLYNLLKRNFDSLEIPSTPHEWNLFHREVTRFNEDTLAKWMREKDDTIDRNDHLPYPGNQIKVGDKFYSGSLVSLTHIDECLRPIFATQAPMESTQPTFWQAVEENHVSCIMTLTDLVKGAEVSQSFVPYWPQSKETPLIFEGVGKVELLKSETVLQASNGELILNEYRFTPPITGKDKGSLIKEKGRVIQHYIVKGWEDGKAIENRDILCRLVTTLQSASDSHPFTPPLVHCISGIGRTGVVIGCFYAAQLKKHCPKLKLDPGSLIVQLWLALRLQRSRLIHTQDQFLQFLDFVKGV